MFDININRLLFYLLAPVKRYLPTGELTLRVRWWQYLFSPLKGLLRLAAIKRKTQFEKAALVAERNGLIQHLKKITDDYGIEIVSPERKGVFVSSSSVVNQTGLYTGDIEGGVYVGTPKGEAWTIIYTTADVGKLKKELGDLIFAGIYHDVQYQKL